MSDDEKYRRFKCFYGHSNVLTFWNMCMAQPLRHSCNRVMKPRSTCSFIHNLYTLLIMPVIIVGWIIVGVIYGALADFCMILMWTLTCGYCGRCCDFDGLLSIRYSDVEDTLISHKWGGAFFEDTWSHSSTLWEPAEECCKDVCCPYVNA